MSPPRSRPALADSAPRRSAGASPGAGRFTRPRPAASEARRLTAAGTPAARSGFFDVEIDFPAEKPDWSRDYRTGRGRRSVFYGDVDYRDERVVGDSKYTWELNRHQFLVPWAVECAETGDEARPRPSVAVVLDWIAANPRYRRRSTGQLPRAWPCGSCRGASPSSSAADAPLTRAGPAPTCWRSVAEQADFVRHTLSGHSSANNHLLGELVGLLAAGVFFPDARAHGGHAPMRAAPRFIEEMRRQNFADGVNREQAVYYHHYVARVPARRDAPPRAAGPGRPGRPAARSPAAC